MVKLNRKEKFYNLFFLDRFGFHQPPLNSMPHIHLHCFVLPFKTRYFDEEIYGKDLTSVEDMIKKIKKKKI